MGHWIRFIPYPVVGGFLAGTGWLLVSGAFKVMAGLPVHMEHLRQLAKPGMSVRWLPGLVLAGLMAVPPVPKDPEGSRPHCISLRRMRDDLRARLDIASLVHLSMGMTLDYEIAIEEGATLVRIGTALFGSRP